MYTTEYLASAFERNVRIIRMQTEGLTHVQSLIQLPFRANSMNWIIGHIVTNRNNVLKLLGADDLINPLSVDRYIRDTEPITPQSQDIIPFEKLLELLTDTQEKIRGRLVGLSPEELNRSVAFFGNTEMTVAEWLLFFYFHDCYHTGQTEILRQAAGVDDKII